MKTLTPSAILLAFLLAQTHAATPLPGQKFIYKQSSGQDQAIEVYFPPGHDPAKAKVPGVILFHGGGWRGGGLEHIK